jgi:hypothetical protein
MPMQIEWIQKNHVKENIAYVAHMGDITEHSDNPVTLIPTKNPPVSAGGFSSP